MSDRRTIASALSNATLTTPAQVELVYDAVAMVPNARVVKIGGQSIMDRGRAAVFPILEEIVAVKERYALLLGCGGGTRARHIYSIAADLEMPTGVLAALGGYVPMQNARMLQMLLARHGGIYIQHDDFEKLPLYFNMRCIPIITGMPPFSYWERPGENTQIPANRTDAGVFLTAEVLGAPRVYFVKDEDGLFDDDPKKNPKARLIPRIGAQELLDAQLPDMALERSVVEYLTRSRFCHEVQILNGLERNQLTRALDGENVGTVIFQD